MKNQKKSNAEMEELAEKVRTLIMFSAMLLPDKKKIKGCFEYCDDRASKAMAMAPILGAFGKDYEEVHLQASVEAKRAKAIYDLLVVLEETEIERAEFMKDKKIKDANLAHLMQFLS